MTDIITNRALKRKTFWQKLLHAFGLDKPAERKPMATRKRVPNYEA